MKKEVIYVLTAIAVAAGLYFIFRSVGSKKKSDRQDEVENQKEIEDQSFKEEEKNPDPFEGKDDLLSSEGLDETEELWISSYGPSVVSLQKDLNKHFDSGLKIDGKFGKNTMAAVKKTYGYERPFMLVETIE